MIIEIYTKEKFAFNEEQNLINKLSYFIFCKNARESKLYYIEGNYSQEEKKIIASEILSDKIVENYSFRRRKFKNNFFRFEIWFKDGITDVVAESVSNAIEDYGFDRTKKVKTGKAIYIETDNFEKARKAVKECFVNELIQKSQISELEKEYLK